MSDMMNDFKKNFLLEELNVFETDFWIWSLRPNQVTIGSSIISLKRPCPNFSGLLEEEFSDLKNIIKVIEPTLKHLFNYDSINYLMLMMVDKHVHYHVIPRYKKTFELFGQVWKDESWPTIPILNGENNELNDLLEVSNFIKKSLIL